MNALQAGGGRLADRGVLVSPALRPAAPCCALRSALCALPSALCSTPLCSRVLAAATTAAQAGTTGCAQQRSGELDGPRAAAVIATPNTLGGKEHQLLNCDDRQHIICKVGKNIAELPARHHTPGAACAARLADQQGGSAQVYIHTAQNVLTEVYPQISIPRTVKRFCGLMVKLLH